MKMSKEYIIAKTIGIEGDYTNDPKDSGGETNFGITKRTARAYGYKGDMKSLTKKDAIEIYKKGYWDRLNLDDVCLFSSDVAMELFDTAVNIGPGGAARFLQRSLNVLNNGAKYYPDIVVDGEIGVKTILSLRKFFEFRGKPGVEVLLKMLNSLQGAFYIELAESTKKDERFIFGWFANRVAL